jgi:hypothetical protein
VETEPAFLQDYQPYRFLPWLSVQYATSPEITEQQTPYTSFQAFVPFTQWNSGHDSGLLYFNGDAFVNNYGLWGSNIGGGGRLYNCCTDRILGFNAFWDNNDTRFGTNNQFGLGVESLGRYIDIRGNGYIPLGDTQKLVGITFTNPAFVNHFIVLNQNTFTASALSGFDTELGGWVPYLGCYGLRAYGGLYAYEGPDVPWFTGGHFRLEERATDNLTLNLTVDADRKFGNTVLFSAMYRFGGGSRRHGSSRGNVFSRLVDPVDRNVNITVLDPEETTEVYATKPGTNTPIYLDHFASYAPAGGNGTFEHPFNTLQNPVVPQQADILFLWANSVFNRQIIVLLNNQRLLGEGITHLFTASQGTFVLPHATDFTTSPFIENTRGVAVTLANNDEVSGLAFNNIIGHAIEGRDVTGVLIDNNAIGTSGFRGLAAIELAYDTPGTYTALLSKNYVQFSRGNGIEADIVDGTVQLTMNNNTVINGSRTGIAVNEFGSGALTLSMTGNNVSNNNGTGIELERTNVFGTTASFSATLTGNTVSGNGSEGILAVDSAVFGSAPSPMRVDLYNNSTSNNGGAGIMLVSFSVFGGQASILSHATGNTLNGDNTAGIDADGFVAETFGFIGGAPSMALLLGGDTSTPANGAGFSLLNIGGSFLFQNGGGNTGTINTFGITNGTVPP